MATKTPTKTERAIEEIRLLGSVRAIRRWEGVSNVRNYIDMMHVDRSRRGDTTFRAWIDERAGELRLEDGSGVTSDAFRRDVESLIALARTLGTVTRDYSRGWDMTVVLAE